MASCCTKVIMSGVNDKVIMSGCGDDNPDDEKREAAKDIQRRVFRGPDNKDKTGSLLEVDTSTT